MSWVNVDQIAEYLGLSPHTIRKLAQRGEIPYGRVGRRLIFSREDCERFARARGSAGQADVPVSEEVQKVEAAAEIADSILNAA